VEKLLITGISGGQGRLLASRVADQSPPILPIHPPEVWACGCTYEMSAAFRDAEHGTREGMYAYVYREARPEVFFKGTARVCVGPDKNIGIRSDSHFTAPEPELAVILGQGGEIVGYTLANDVSAWDIERENALYLPQSKVYNCCCALGPVIVTADELKDPYNLTLTCTIGPAGSTPCTSSSTAASAVALTDTSPRPSSDTSARSPLRRARWRSGSPARSGARRSSRSRRPP